jgi:hypothetical protein
MPSGQGSVMPNTDESKLLPLSEYQRMREQAALAEGGALGRATVLPSTMLAELRDWLWDDGGGELIDVLAACRRHGEPALVCLSHQGLVWPITVFPAEMTYHSPQDLLGCTDPALAQLTVLSIEPAAVRPPGHSMHERVPSADLFRPLAPMLWAVALRGPSRHALVPAIAGTAAYRVARNIQGDGLTAPGALGGAVERLRRESASLRAISTWPGMDLERGIRLLNALYLVSNLIVTRAHPAARAEPRSPYASGRT